MQTLAIRQEIDTARACSPLQQIRNPPCPEWLAHISAGEPQLREDALRAQFDAQ